MIPTEKEAPPKLHKNLNPNTLTQFTDMEAFETSPTVIGENHKELFTNSSYNFVKSIPTGEYGVKSFRCPLSQDLLTTFTVVFFNDKCTIFKYANFVVGKIEEILVSQDFSKSYAELMKYNDSFFIPSNEWETVLVEYMNITRKEVMTYYYDNDIDTSGKYYDR